MQLSLITTVAVKPFSLCKYSAKVCRFIANLYTSSTKICAGIVFLDRLHRIMQLSQIAFLILGVVSVAWFFKTDNTNALPLAAFFFTLSIV